MGIIDLNIERPAWKRTEVAETEETEQAVTEESEAEPESRRVPRTVAVVGGLVAGAVGLLTLRKVRNRRRDRKQE